MYVQVNLTICYGGVQMLHFTGLYWNYFPLSGVETYGWEEQRKCELCHICDYEYFWAIKVSRT